MKVRQSKLIWDKVRHFNPLSYNTFAVSKEKEIGLVHFFRYLLRQLFCFVISRLKINLY